MKMKITKCYSGTLILWYSFDSVDVCYVCHADREIRRK